MSPAHLPNQSLSMIVAIYKAGGKEGNSWYHTGESPATLNKKLSSYVSFSIMYVFLYALIMYTCTVCF